MTTKRAIRIVLTLLFALLAAVSLTRTLDSRGSHFVDEGLHRSLVAFGIARGLNAVVSVAQNTEVALQPVGFGVTLAPGQILDPINDLIERFSWVMLASATAFGIQQFLLSISAWWPFAALSAALLLGGAAAPWFAGRGPPHLQRVLLKLALIALFLRFAVPLTAIADDYIYRQFLAGRYESATLQLESTGRELEQISAEKAEYSSFLGWAQQLLDSATDMVDVNAKLARYRQAVDDTARQAVDLIVVFLLQTVLLPVAFLLAAWGLARRLLRGEFEFLS